MNQRLALGTAQFGLTYGIANIHGKVSEAEVRCILQEAARLRMDTLDTAMAYGESETVLGHVGVADYRIVTKLPGIPETVYDVERWVREQTNASLDRLCVNQLDGVLLHRPDQLLGPKGEQLYKAIQRLKSDGLTRKIGVSIYVPGQLDALQSHFNFDLVQAPLSILDRRLVVSGWTTRLRQMDIELHIRSVFLQGLLLMGSHERPTVFDRWRQVWANWENWLTETGLTPIQACLRYAFSITDVDRVVVGIDSLEQLRLIASAGNEPLPSLPQWPNDLDNQLLNPSLWNLS